MLGPANKNWPSASHGSMSRTSLEGEHTYVFYFTAEEWEERRDVLLIAIIPVLKKYIFT